MSLKLALEWEFCLAQVNLRLSQRRDDNSVRWMAYKPLRQDPVKGF